MSGMGESNENNWLSEEYFLVKSTWAVFSFYAISYQYHSQLTIERYLMSHTGHCISVTSSDYPLNEVWPSSVISLSWCAALNGEGPADINSNSTPQSNILSHSQLGISLIAIDFYHWISAFLLALMSPSVSASCLHLSLQYLDFHALPTKCYYRSHQLLCIRLMRLEARSGE